MKIHEYQAKQILARYGVRIPRGEIAYTKDEAAGLPRNSAELSSSRRRFMPAAAEKAAASRSRRLRSRPSSLPSRCWA